MRGARISGKYVVRFMVQILGMVKKIYVHPIYVARFIISVEMYHAG